MRVGWEPRRVALVVIVAGLLAVGSAAAQSDQEQEPLTVPVEKAREHIGEKVRVCGAVTETSHMQAMEGRPTFINFGDPYPERSLGVVIYEEHAQKFRRRPDRLFRDRFVCVTGVLGFGAGSPRMVVTDPEAIEIIEPETDACGSGITS